MTNAPIVPLFAPPWLAGAVAAALQIPPAAVSLAALSGDAGSRVYYRAAAGGRTYIAAVDSAAEQQQRFTRLAPLFRAAGARVPQVLAEDASRGFLLLEDFGDVTYLACLPQEASALYPAALAALVGIQCSAALAAALPPYSEAMLTDEMRLFDDWYCARHCARPLPPAAAAVTAEARRYLAAAMLAMPAAAVHRDYHSRNLMRPADGGAPGMLDFQDAVRGAALYDVVSLLRDAYIGWTAAEEEGWLDEYWRLARAAGAPAGETLEDCRQWFNIAGAQRGLKVLGIFARLAYRDGKRGYLADLPRVYRHTLAACAALPALSALAAVLADYAPPALAEE